MYPVVRWKFSRLYKVIQKNKHFIVYEKGEYEPLLLKIIFVPQIIPEF
tara:strand:- start:1081 stop:1224 length:144 start_codon:yes stop_codon:yes gene_type:complete